MLPLRCSDSDNWSEGLTPKSEAFRLRLNDLSHVSRVTERKRRPPVRTQQLLQQDGHQEWSFGDILCVGTNVCGLVSVAIIGDGGGGG